MAESLELLAPCRNADIGIEAISHGADAVYIGGPLFSARANAGNSLSEIERLAKYAHTYGARVYMALNTILTDEQLPKASRLAWQAYEAGVDALIVQDMGLLMSQLPPLQLHASTQCDIRTPEKALFLQNAGFSQIVPARELRLEEIAAIHRVLRADCRIEFFIHGALCVSYSGQCYAGQAFRARSANCGACPQICRLPFKVSDLEGNTLLERAHALSLKDNNQSEHLEELVSHGVRSFKIEGRYKDLGYVKNTTAFYRQKLDAFLAQHPEFVASSEGKTTFSFEPAPLKGFNRGTTDYFVGECDKPMADFNSPKNAGSPIGTVTELAADGFYLKSAEEIRAGDGLTYWQANGELAGLLVSAAHLVDVQCWKIQTRWPMNAYPDIKPGLKIMRNKEAAWLKLMSGKTARRVIPIAIRLEATDATLKAEARDKAGHRVSATLSGSFADAENAELARARLENSLKKSGQTEFTVSEVQLEGKTKFLPTSVVNGLRRQLLEKLSRLRQTSFTRLEKAPAFDTPYPQTEVDFRANVLNDKAREFYTEHGATVTEPAFESGQITREVELMRTRYCLRREMGLCPKQAKQRGQKIRPEPLILRSGDIEMTARFFCKPCEMGLYGRKR